MTIEKMITTSLVHPRDTGETPWWQTTVVCDIPGLHNNQSLGTLKAILKQLADSGFETLLVRPASPMLEEDFALLPRFIAQAHEFGLRILVRVFQLPAGQILTPPDETPQLGSAQEIKSITERIVAALEAGADGVDLGTIKLSLPKWNTEEQLAAFSEAVQVALAEIAISDDTAILSAALPAFPEEDFNRHLADDWFHHLRSSLMLEVPWNAQDLQKAVVSAYRSHDPLGHTVPWRHVLQRWSASLGHEGNANIGWAKGAPESRYDAMTLFVSSLPGAVYLPFIYTGGSVEYEGPDGTEIVLEYGKGALQSSRSQLFRHALHIRKDHGMATAPLAIVSGLSWAQGGVSVHLTGSTMVVLNVDSAPVTVPQRHALLVSSPGAMPAPGGGTILPPETCAWFQTAEPIPLDPAHYR